MGAVWTTSSHGVDWRLELSRADLLPGRLVDGKIRLTAHRAVDARALLVTLRGVERWKHEETTSDGQGGTTTRTVTSVAALPPVPVEVAGEVHLADGETRDLAFQVPVPGLGPASLEADALSVTWEIEAKLDMPGGLDSAIDHEIRILQPTALLRAGVIDVGATALFDAADVAAGGVTGIVELDPVPPCCGAPFRGRVTLHAPRHMDLQEIRAEIRVTVKATVPGGISQVIVPWAAILVPGATLDGDRTIEFDGRLDDIALPTSELPHGTSVATFHLILARAWATDPHLVREIALCTTTEI